MTTAKTTSKPVKAKPERSSGKESFKADSALAGAEEERSARDKAKKSKKRMEPKVGTLPESDAPLREYPSMSALSGATGIPLDVIKAAKVGGCSAFKSTRVQLIPLLRWIFGQDGEVGVEDWSQELAKVKTLRERIKLLEDEGRVIAFEHVREGLGIVMSIMFGCLDRWSTELPPAIKGLSEMEIKKRMDEATERLRVDLKAKLDAVSKEGGSNV